ncbi:MAG: TetR/AcrR family transcriptional regulator [Deltaproteobacteria bacterium]|jgi:AcrR family transcriptional regulator|nr:TetR/AcrR family transcriptional regulator [Deltaproteobacteria bacterium]
MTTGQVPLRTRRRSSAQEARRDFYRARLVEVAEALFAEKGFESTKMEEVAEEAGLSLGTVYSAFRGKSAILEALHETRLKELLSVSVAATRNLRGSVEILVAGMRGFVEFFLDNPDFLRIHLRDSTSWGLPMPGRSPRVVAWEKGQAILIGILEQGIREGAFYADDPSRFARTCAAIGEIRLGDWLSGGMSEQPEVILTDVERQLRRAVCCREEDRTAPVRPR